MILATKWLEGGRFTWPPIREGKIMLSATQLAMLLDGLSEWLKIAPRAAARPIKTA
jgi:transposase